MDDKIIEHIFSDNCKCYFHIQTHKVEWENQPTKHIDEYRKFILEELQKLVEKTKENIGYLLNNEIDRRIEFWSLTLNKEPELITYLNLKNEN